MYSSETYIIIIPNAVLPSSWRVSLYIINSWNYRRLIPSLFTSAFCRFVFGYCICSALCCWLLSSWIVIWKRLPLLIFFRFTHLSVSTIKSLDYVNLWSYHYKKKNECPNCYLWYYNPKSRFRLWAKTRTPYNQTEVTISSSLFLNSLSL